MSPLCSSTGPIGAGIEGVQLPAGDADSSSQWRATIARVLPAVVVLRVSYVRAFDGEDATYSYATGFVVDAARGLILTNRHVVSTGPVTAEAVFLNKEEVTLTAVYRDPLHDFGFFTFDPKDVSFMTLTQIALAPDAAEVGLEIRVVGNDAGEKMSILSGTLARLDRPAPKYSSKTYNDANTFYYSAASNTSGGSSGSPVLDIHGRAVALNAGAARRAASSYYLPLHRVARALEHLQRGATPTRGTLRAVFKYSTFDECRRLGLSTDAEAAVRAAAPEGTGMLVCEHVIPGGPAAVGGGAARLEAGDVLLRVSAGEAAARAAAGGAFCLAFLQLEALIDEQVGAAVAVAVQRGGELVQLCLEVEDMYALTPSSFLEVGGCVFHPISLVQARNGNLDPSAGVYVAYAGFMLDTAGLPGHSVVTAVGGVRTRTLDELEAALVAVADDEHALFRYFEISEPHKEHVALVQVSRRWFPSHAYARHGSDWARRELARSAASKPTPRAAVSFTLTGSAAVRAVIPSICRVTFDVAFAIDGCPDWHFAGAGLVLCASAGFVLVDRNTLPTSLGDIKVSFGASAEVSARCVFSHPHHNYALLRYDAALVSGVQSARLADESRDVRIGDEFEFAGLSASSADMVVSQAVRAIHVSALDAEGAAVPCFRAINEEVISLDRPPLDVLGGVLVDSTGAVAAVWASYSVHDRSASASGEAFRAHSVRGLREVLSALQAGAQPLLHSCEIELSMVPLSTAVTKLGLSRAHAQTLQAQHDERCQCLVVGMLLPWSGARGGVLEGDVLLSVDSQPVVTFRDVELRVAGTRTAELEVLRHGEELRVTVPTSLLDGIGTRQVLIWQGLVMQPAHRAVAQLGFWPFERGGVYVAYYFFGSSAHRHALNPKMWIRQVNATLTPDIDSFIAATAQLEAGSAVRLKTVDLQGREAAHTLKLDPTFWPTRLFTLADGGEWREAVLTEQMTQPQPAVVTS